MSLDVGKLNNLKSYISSDGVMVGNGKIFPIAHVGDATITTDHLPLHLKNVLLVPNIKKNLISSQLTTDLPYSIKFCCDGYVINDRRTRQIVATGSKKGGLYALDYGNTIFDDEKTAIFLKLV